MQLDDEQVADEESPTGEISSVGQMLRTAREALDLPIEQLAGDLRIDPRYLTALEENEFGEFSAPVFAKGYLKQYAIRLGLDEKGLLTEYYRQVGAPEVRSLPTQSLYYSADWQQARWLIAASAVVFVVAALSIWRFNTPEPEAPVVRQPAASVPESEPAELVTDTTEADETVIMQPEPVAAVIDAPVETGIATLQVEIIFAEDCWTEVIDARGERLFYGLGSAGARTRFTAMPPLSFFLGNASGVEVLVDEMPYEIPADNREGNLARFVILEAGD
jgi:cytoskeleton protein RodZ